MFVLNGEDYSLEELESMPWYDLVEALGINSFNWAGMGTWDELLKLCSFDVSENKEAQHHKESMIKILMVGCNVGTSAFYIHEKYGFDIVGIDLEEKLINTAINTATQKGVSDFVKFQIADAHKLPFDSDSFDSIYTEYMAYFLDLPKALFEFKRVLKEGGFIGFNELMKDNEISDYAEEKILYAQKVFTELVGYDLIIPKIEEYEKLIKSSGFSHIEYMRYTKTPGIKEGIAIIGGWKNLFKMLVFVLKLSRKSKIIKEKLRKQKEVKKYIMRDKKTAKYIKPVIMAAKK